MALLTRSFILAALYIAVSALACYMVCWVLVFPSSWLVGNELHDKLLNQAFDTMEDVGGVVPTPRNLIFKYKMHPAVQLMHTLPSAVWSIAIPFQLHPDMRSSYPRLHRLSGYTFFAAACTMMCGLFVIDSRNLYYWMTDFPGIPEEVAMTRFATALGWFPHHNGFRLLGVWFLFTILYSVWCARKRRYRMHRDYLYRHIGAGIWVALQRLYVGALADPLPMHQKMNFGDGALLGAIVSIALAEVAVHVSRSPVVKPPTKGQKKQ